MTRKIERLGRMSRRRFVALTGAGVAGATAPFLLGGVARAQTYPSGRVEIVVGYSPGGAADITARILADYLQNTMGGEFIVTNRPGAGGNIAARYVASAEPDGATLLLGNTGEMAINKHLLENVDVDPDAELQAVALGYITPHIMAVPHDSPFETLEDYLAAARERPGRVQFASAGLGTPGHLAGEMLIQVADVDLIHVPYQGGSQALADVVGGQVDCYFSSLPAAVGYMESGDIRPLAITSNERSSRFPDVPTVAEVVGVEEFDFPLWGGLFAPTGTNEAIVEALNEAVRGIADDEDVLDQIASMNFDVLPMTSDEFAQLVQAESDKYQDLISTAGISAQ